VRGVGRKQDVGRRKRKETERNKKTEKEENQPEKQRKENTTHTHSSAQKGEHVLPRRKLFPTTQLTLIAASDSRVLYACPRRPPVWWGGESTLVTCSHQNCTASVIESSLSLSLVVCHLPRRTISFCSEPISVAFHPLAIASVQNEPSIPATHLRSIPPPIRKHSNETCKLVMTQQKQGTIPLFPAPIR
jgi:hypothetical protein